jgi:Tripartite tricarboxylate transporter family receptor
MAPNMVNFLGRQGGLIRGRADAKKYIGPVPSANVDMTFVPYPGVAPAVNALLGGHVTSVFASYSTLSAQLNSGCHQRREFDRKSPV